MSRCPKAAVPPPTIPRDPKTPQPPGPHDPPSAPSTPPQPRKHAYEPEDCCPDNLTPSVMYPGMLTFKPSETCRHGFHGAVMA